MHSIRFSQVLNLESVAKLDDSWEFGVVELVRSWVDSDGLRDSKNERERERHVRTLLSLSKRSPRRDRK